MAGTPLLRAVFLALAVVAGVASAAAADQIGDTLRGEALFRDHCSGCHEVGEAAQNRVGPRLNGVFGRHAGSVARFSYSRSMLRMGSDGLVWTLESLDAYLENPRSLVSGTRMAFPGLADPGARAALIAYLRTWSDQPRDIPEAEPTARATAHDPDPAILALDGDPEYGAYLSVECVTCHQRNGSDKGIPSIVHWAERDFIMAMQAYKRNLRPHPVMQMVAGRLSDQEIAALAAYFATLR